jgi:hypothetical protein
MGLESAVRVADAVLFEGYVLYPYRASAIKNRLRWQFGVLAPPAPSPPSYAEPSFAQTECLAEPRGGEPMLRVRARFLQLQMCADTPPWDEGVARTVDARTPLAPGTVEVPFRLAGGGGRCRRWPLSGTLRIVIEPLPGPYGLLRVQLRIENRTPWMRATSREEMLRRSLVAAHALLGVEGGVFLSMSDPPEWAKGAAAGCINLHTWPCLIDDTTVLSAPIILDDHPEIAPESPLGLCDATEIDELLVLRTMALTDQEKHDARATGDRAAEIIDYAETIPPEVFERLHGTVRVSRPPRAGPNPRPDTDSGDAVLPPAEAVTVTGGRAEPGTKVRLRPGRRRADVHDMFLTGRLATVAAVLTDIDGAAYLAVTVDDDPAAALKNEVGRYLYFAPDEVELS